MTRLKHTLNLTASVRFDQRHFSMSLRKKIEARLRFSPRRAVNLLREKPHREMDFLNIWQMCRLIAWATLDQRSGKRVSRSTYNGGPSQKKTIKTRNAKIAGHMLLAYLADRVDRRNEDHVKEIAAIFQMTGGFSQFLRGRSFRDIISDFRSREVEREYIYRIVSYLVRYQKHMPADSNYTLASAWTFVSLSVHRNLPNYGESKIEKIWAEYKVAAPYIFAFHPVIRFSSGKASPEAVFARLTGIVSKQERIDRLLGRAAYAANVLQGVARDVRTKDFRGIAPQISIIPAFSQAEIENIQVIDRDAPLA